LEAAVQRNIENAAAWFELGVKQQENEREYKALQALQRAVELDPSHLPAWLALAISYTNNSNRQGTYDAIYEWVNRNTKYQDPVQQFFAQNPRSMSSPMAERYSQLIQCLITMVRSNTTGEIDADIQVALAVLLNTNEVCLMDIILMHVLFANMDIGI
jgi:peroxin-5